MITQVELKAINERATRAQWDLHSFYMSQNDTYRLIEALEKAIGVIRFYSWFDINCQDSKNYSEAECCVDDLNVKAREFLKEFEG